MPAFLDTVTGRQNLFGTASVAYCGENTARLGYRLVQALAGKYRRWPDPALVSRILQD